MNIHNTIHFMVMEMKFLKPKKANCKKYENMLMNDFIFGTTYGVTHKYDDFKEISSQWTVALCVQWALFIL